MKNGESDIIEKIGCAGIVDVWPILYGEEGDKVRVYWDFAVSVMMC
jgi:hypothetical protein